MFRQLLACTLLFSATGVIRGQATINVDLADHVYRDIDVLVAHGLVPTVLVGQRPYSRREVARIIRDASLKLDARKVQLASASGSPPDESASAMLRTLVTALQTEYRDELRFFTNSASGLPRWRWRLLDESSVDLTRVTGSGRDVPYDNGLGKIDAFINPLVSNREGRTFHEGDNLQLETVHSLEGSHFALSLNPQFALSDSASWKDSPRLRLQSAQLRLLFGNFAVDLGRETILWGQGQDVGLINSINAPPLDVLKLSNDLPLRLPWFLRSFGPTKLSIFYADLGADQNYPGAHVIGYKMSVAPSSRLELGGTVYSKAGGLGAPHGTFTASIVDLFPFLESSAYDNRFGTRGVFVYSDRYAGLDGRLRFPSARGLELFSEIVLNDFDIRRIESCFWEDAAHVFGATIPRVGPNENWDLSAEFHHTGIRVYRHHQFMSGQTFDRMMTGDQLGPDAMGGYLRLRWLGSMTHRWDLVIADERRSDDQYVGDGLDNGSLIFRRIEIRPKEMRLRAVSTWGRTVRGSGAELIGQLGYERTRNFDFAPGSDRNGFLGRIGWQYHFR